jgi:iron complex transport system substrate-binding protein
LQHAFGETEIAAEPVRVATWGWGASEAVLALGVVPVAMAEQTYGADTNGVLPWTAAKLAELGERTPTILPDGEHRPTRT